MKFNIEQLNFIAKALSEISEKPMKISLAFKLNALLDKITNHLANAERIRRKLLVSYGTKVEGKEQTIIPDEHVDIFNKELKELLSQEVEIEFEPFDISELGDIEISLVQMKGISLIIKGK